MDDDYPSFDFSGFDNLDISNLLSGDGGSSGVDFSQIGGDYGGSLSDELAAALSNSGNASSLFSGNGGLDIASLMGESQGDLDQAAPPIGIADLLATISKESGGDLANTDWAALANEGLTPEQIAKREEMMKYASDRNQDFGGADVTKYMDEFNKNFQPAGGFGSQWQTSGSDRIMVNDDGTGIGINTETGESYALDKNQVDKMVSNGQLNTKDSGYVSATGGVKDIPGGGKTVVNKDGTKTVTTTDGKTYIINKDGTVTPGKDTTTTVTKTIDNTKTDANAGAKSSNTGMLMALLALMAMMNKGGGSSGSGAVIPSLAANRKQLPYGPISGSTARPGAGGVTYFSPTTYTQRAAGGGMMYGSGGISDLGGYSDGGRLLKGPGDGVSDSIPATIGGKQPARLAEGEFVVPARIVSELGNGSTDAGAQKLYAMMDRVQKARRKTKNVAADTKAHKYLPA